MNKLIIIISILLFAFCSYSQKAKSGFVLDAKTKDPLELAVVKIGEQIIYTDEKGYFEFTTDNLNSISFKIRMNGYFQLDTTLTKCDGKLELLLKRNVKTLGTANAYAKRTNYGSIIKPRAIEGLMITSGKKIELIQVDKSMGNPAVNSARHLYAKIPGLNIWESDGAGIQLGIGGRGLSPTRTSNYNTRQNGYDMSADALGYPEAYYNPPSEALDQIQFLKGASSLQYGAQFGGTINFKLKHGLEKPFSVGFTKTYGSFDLDAIFLDFGGSYKRVQYYGYFQNKSGNEWRPNSQYDLFNGGIRFRYHINEKHSINLDVSKMNYLAQQSGGLTDLEFELTPTLSKRERNWFTIDWNMVNIQWKGAFRKNVKIESNTFGLAASRKSVGFLGQINRVDPLQERNLIIGEYLNFGNETKVLKMFELNDQTQAFLAGIRLYKGSSRGRQGFADTTAGPSFGMLQNNNLEYSDYQFPSFNAALFVEQIFNINKNTSIIPGIRAEHISTNANGSYNDVIYDLAGNAIFDSIYSEERNRKRNFFIMGIGIQHKIKGDSLMIYSNLTQNYRGINFTDMQIINPNFRIDPDLEDERGFNFDLGTKGFIGDKLYWDASIYALFYNNRIGTIIQVDTALFNTYQYRTNVSRSLTLGFEGILHYKWLDKKMKSTAFINYSYSYGKYLQEDNFRDNNFVELVPPVNYKTGFDLSYNKFELAYQFSWTHWHYSDASNSLAQPNAVNGIIPSYYVMDVSIKYQIEQLRLGFGVNNLTNQSYFTRRAVSYPGPGIIPSAPRNFFFSLGIKM